MPSDPTKRFYLISIALLALFTDYTFSQSRFGIEFKGSVAKTENSGQLMGGSGGYSGYSIFEESDPVTYGYSIGLVYYLNERNLLKLHFGHHENGRILSFIQYDDAGNSYTEYNYNHPYFFFQLSPSYTFRLIHKKWIIPIEMGINVNKWNSNIKLFYLPIHEYNFDYEISTGIDYRFNPFLVLGMHAVYTANLNEYQLDEEVEGTYEPKQFGVELSFLYQIENEAPGSKN